MPRHMQSFADCTVYTLYAIWFYLSYRKWNAPPIRDKQQPNYIAYVVNSRVFLLVSENAFEMLSALMERRGTEAATQ